MKRRGVGAVEVRCVLLAEHRFVAQQAGQQVQRRFVEVESLGQPAVYRARRVMVATVYMVGEAALAQQTVLQLLPPRRRALPVSLLLAFLDAPALDCAQAGTMVALNLLGFLQTHMSGVSNRMIRILKRLEVQCPGSGRDVADEQAAAAAVLDREGAGRVHPGVVELRCIGKKTFEMALLKELETYVHLRGQPDAHRGATRHEHLEYFVRQIINIWMSRRGWGRMWLLWMR